MFPAPQIILFLPVELHKRTGSFFRKELSAEPYMEPNIGEHFLQLIKTRLPKTGAGILRFMLCGYGTSLKNQINELGNSTAYLTCKRKRSEELYIEFDKMDEAYKKAKKTHQ